MKNKVLTLSLIGSLLLITIDQMTKNLVRTNIAEDNPINLINGFFRISYVENRGITFGLFQNAGTALIPVIILASIIILFLLLSGKVRTKLHIISLSLILSGAIGNLLDRIFFGYVTDMIDFYGIWHFVFNFADCCLVVGAFMILIYEIFLNKGEQIE